MPKPKADNAIAADLPKKPIATPTLKQLNYLGWQLTPAYSGEQCNTMLPHTT
ncbi:hypothetical protein [Agarivorans sp. Z349TD_8]|uniref:hypothetical protein n=1 Tax=Agarivorans sp. Z349TD_8 TaxID=3421434 RepID=UPI003D7C9AA5